MRSPICSSAASAHVRLRVLCAGQHMLLVSIPSTLSTGADVPPAQEDWRIVLRKQLVDAGTLCSEAVGVTEAERMLTAGAFPALFCVVVMALGNGAAAARMGVAAATELQKRKVSLLLMVSERCKLRLGQMAECSLARHSFKLDATTCTWPVHEA